MNVDWLIVGAGFTGSILAERIANICNEKVLLVEKGIISQEMVK